MIGTTRVESNLALRALVAAGKIVRNAKHMVAVTAKNGFGVALGSAPNNGGVVNRFIVALNASIEDPAAFEFDGDKVALGVVVSTLSALVHTDAMANDSY